MKYTGEIAALATAFFFALLFACIYLPFSVWIPDPASTVQRINKITTLPVFRERSYFD